MAFIRRQNTLDYQPCRYKGARINFRGPKKDLGQPYLAFLGGSETYGKFVALPFPERVERAIGISCVNLGCMNAGVDAFLQDPEILGIALQSQATVIQIMGAQNVSNRLYRVHPRRNDRFIGASEMMQSMFREVDFTDYNFTRHMIHDIAHLAGDRFAFVRDELRRAWMSRMSQLLDQIEGTKLLLWFAAQYPPPEAGVLPGVDPWFIDRNMIERLRPSVDALVEVKVSKEAQNDRLDGKVFDPLERPAADLMFGAEAHEEVSRALVPVLRSLGFSDAKTGPAIRARLKLT